MSVEPGPTDHTGCREFLRRRAAANGLDVTVSTAPPIVIGPYPPEGYKCPHGIQLWMEPTGEQIAEWVRTGTR